MNGATKEALDERDVALSRALGPEPKNVTDIMRELGLTDHDDHDRNRNRRRRVSRRLEKMPQARAVIGPGGERLWRSEQTMGAGQATGAVGVCERTGKYQYPSEDIAGLAQDLIRKAINHSNRPIRSYSCPSCGFWHLTSQVRRGRTT